MNYKEWRNKYKNRSLFNLFALLKNCYIVFSIFKSRSFDSQFYFKEYTDIAKSLNSGIFYRLSCSQNRIIRNIGKAVVHPIQHYVWKGVYEGKNPSRDFNTIFYIESNPDVAQTGINPFFHYLKYGEKEGRKPILKLIDQIENLYSIDRQINIIQNSQLFDETYYLERNPDVAEAKMDPVEHYCKFGWTENRDPSELFETKYYLEQNEDVREEGLNPLIHYILIGREQKRIPREELDPVLLKRNSTIVFVGHEAEQTGAPVILLDIIKWFNRYTAYNVKVILLRGGALREEYEKSAETLLLNMGNNKKDIREQILNFISDKNSLVFLNTVVSARIFNYVDLKEFPKVAFIHELEKTMKLFPEESKLLKKNVNNLIAASDSVTNNLIVNHGYDSSHVQTVFAFIDPQNQFLVEQERKERRKQLNIALDKVIIYSCGTLYWRKNPKGFIEIAEKVINKGNKNCEFIWIGDGEEKEICENLIKKKSLQDYIKLIGPVNNPRDYFATGDIFILPAIEDPFPLVCLEAADCGLPIICFDEAGGMPGFVEEDAGIVVPLNDNESMAEATHRLIRNHKLRDTLGRQAREKVLFRHTINKSAQQIKKNIDNELGVTPLVSVIVPNYNHCKYLEERLDSIYNQTFKDIEVILLDDVSTDNSREILNEYARKYPDITRTLFNDKNSGNVFLQWKKGIDSAKSDLIWIAESDDYCDKYFIEKVLAPYKKEDTVLSYSNSNIVGPKGQFYNTYENIPWLTDLNENKWRESYYNRGIDEFFEALSVKCTIPNVSAVIFKKETALKAIDFTFNYKKAGDWIFYAHMSKFGNIAYCAEPLNFHRRHEGSVTSKEGDDRGVEEIYLIHKHFVENFYVPFKVRQSMIDFIEREYDIYERRRSISKAFADLYKKDDILGAPYKQKVAFFQHGLNFGKGGAEKMLIEQANQLFARGYLVSVYNRTNSNEPIPYKINSNIPVYNIGINEDISDFKFRDKPDIAIINSIGHPDVKNIDQFHKSGIPVILAMHNHPKFFDKSPGKKEHMNALDKADCIITLIPTFKEEYLKRNVKTPIVVVPNFVNKPKIEGKFISDKNRKYIFTAGRLVEQKQQSILIEAFAKLASTFPDWDLLIAGEGHLRPDIEQQIQFNRLENRVKLLGEVENIGDYYQQCNLFVLPSKFEGLSLVILEAASFGKPIILFKDCPPYKEIIKEDDGIILVPEMTSNALKDTLSKYMEHGAQVNPEKILKFYSKYSSNTIIAIWESLIKTYSN